MNIDYKEIALASNRRIEKLTEIETQLRALPHHLRSFVPGLDAFIELSNNVRGLDQETQKYLPADILRHLGYLHAPAVSMCNMLAQHGNPLIAAIEPADE